MNSSMDLDLSLEQLLKKVASLDREACKRELRGLREIPLDFTEEFLDAQSTDQLRHVLLAACLQVRKSPEQEVGS